MAKYYVRFGQLDLVLESDSPPQAALAAMDRVLTPHLWIYDDSELSPTECLQHLMMEALLHLPTEISVSEQGFEGRDAVQISTPETIESWHALMVGVQRLFQSAGVNRTIAVLAGKAAATALERVNKPR